MANNKDFKIKNGIQANSYNEKVGTIVSSEEGYDIRNLSSDGVSFDFSTQDSQPNGIFFKPDGTRMYIVGNTGDTIEEYTISTAWDLTSTITNTHSENISGKDSAPFGLFFSSDGLRMYFCGGGSDSVHQYSLSTAWDLSTVSFVRTESVSGQDTNPTDVFFKPDGTKMFILGSTGDDVNQYTLSTAWDISTISFVDATSIATQETSPQGFTFKPDGTKMFMVGPINDSVHEYSLSTAWDTSTLSFVRSASIATQDGSSLGITFKNDGTKLFMVGNDSDSVHQYSSILPEKSLDLSTGSVFEHTPTSDFKLSLINPAASGTLNQATLILDGLYTSAFDVSLAEYDGSYYDVSGEESTLSDLFFKPDGTKMFIIGYGQDEVNEYSLSPAWDIGSATAVSVLDVSSRDTAPVGLAFKPDGTELYMLGQQGDEVNQFTLSTAWDISTAEYTRVKTIASAGGSETTPEAIRFKPDGTKMYISGSTTNAKIAEYALSTAWNIATASFTDTINLSGQGTNPKGFDFNDDGTRLLAVFDNNNTVFQYTLSTAYDVSTATYDDESFVVTTQSTTPIGLAFKSDGEKMYIASSAPGQKVFGYNVSSTTAIVYNDSIELPYGGLGATGRSGETDILVFSTRDGGTTYQGLKAMDGVK